MEETMDNSEPVKSTPSGETEPLQHVEAADGVEAVLETVSDVMANETSEVKDKVASEFEKTQDIDLEGKPEDSLFEFDEEADRFAGAEKRPLAGEHLSVEAETDVDTGGDNKLMDPTKRPPNGCEVFVGGISTETTEKDLQEFCSSAGNVFEVRLKEDRETGLNKGFGFVTFTTKEEAEKAIETLSEKELKGRKVKVSHTQPKNRLFIGNVPKHWDSNELESILKKEGPGILSVELMKDPTFPTRNRGFAFVEFYNHACADMARRNLSNPNFAFGTNVPTISWAEPRAEPDASTMAGVKVVYVRGLPESATEVKIKECFSRVGDVTKVILPMQKPGMARRDFGFVHFAERSQALKALEKDEKHEIDGIVLEVSLARPLPDTRDRREPVHRREEPRSHFSSRSSSSHGYDRVESYGRSSYSHGQSAGYSSRSVAYERRGDPQPAPVIYGRGPVPAGMTMVPMVLPDGRIGYVFQPSSGGGSASGGASASSHYRDSGRSASRSSGRDPPPYNSNSSRGRRYRPY